MPRERTEKWTARSPRSTARPSSRAPSCVEPLERRTLLAVDPALAAWFRAADLTLPAGAAISTWPDSSGHAFNATQTDPAKRPHFEPGVLNGKSAVRFDGAASTQLSFARPVSGDFTMVAVFGASDGVGRSNAWYNGAGILDGDVAGVASDFGLSLNADGRVLAGTGGPDTFVGSGLGFDDGRAHVATVTRVATTGQVSLYVDGRLFQRATGSTQPLTAPPRLTIGATRTGNHPFTGDIGEVRVYSAALADAARAAVESELKSAFNVAPEPAWYTNPVIDRDFPDPGAVFANGSYYAFATNGSGNNVRAARSTDLVTWAALPDAMPNLPTWAQAGRTWAPDVAVTATGTYNLYYTAWSRATGRQAIGVATSSNPAGPFTSAAAAPFIAQTSQGGSIDPSVFTAADGTQYLLWKNDGNAVGVDTWLYIQRLTPDGLTLVGNPTQLIHQDLPWEGSAAEAPVLWTHGGKYYLFYSANYFGDGSYATGYAVSNSLLGPYVKAVEPLLETAGAVVGPGGPEVVTGPDGDTYLLYHSWEDGLSYRAMSVDELEWEGGVPVVRGTGRVTQPVPARPAVVGRRVFYNDSVFDGGNPAAAYTDDAAVAPNKTALLPGGPPGISSVTSYAEGINGVMIDVARLPRDYTPSPADFDFRRGPAPGAPGMAAAPSPTSVTLRRGAGANGSDRITLAWANGAIRDEWLQVTLKATARTLLAAPDTFSFGNFVGKTIVEEPGDWSVSAIDVQRTRAAISRSPVMLTSPYDFNRDGRVSVTDLWIVRGALARGATVAATSATVVAPTRPMPRRRDVWEELDAELVA